MQVHVLRRFDRNRIALREHPLKHLEDLLGRARLGENPGDVVWCEAAVEKPEQLDVELPPQPEAAIFGQQQDTILSLAVNREMRGQGNRPVFEFFVHIRHPSIAGMMAHAITGAATDVPIPKAVL